jgi:hypothetical protein
MTYPLGDVRVVLGSEDEDDGKMARNRGRPKGYLCSTRRTSSPPTAPFESTSILSAYPLPPLPSFRQPCSPAWRLGWFQLGLPSCHDPGPGPHLRPAVRRCISLLCPSHPVAFLRHDSMSNTKNASVRLMCCRPDSLSIAPRRAVVVCCETHPGGYGLSCVCSLCCIMCLQSGSSRPGRPLNHWPMLGDMLSGVSHVSIEISGFANEGRA